MKVSELGEFGLVARIAELINASRDDGAPAWQNLLVGIGDDAAAWRGDGAVQLAKVDALRENVHFTRAIMPWADLGWKSLAINLSDIAAMGGLPRYALVSLAVPDDTDVADVLAFYRGLLELAGKYGVAIIGGDTDRAALIDATVTVLGRAPAPAGLLSRGTAQPGDVVAVTGYLGTAAAGFQALTRKLTLDPGTAQALTYAFLRPTPRLEVGQRLVKAGIRTAIDVSDGLVSDLNHVCQRSRVGARLEVARVPVRPEVSQIFGADALDLALGGGEDYELLFTGSPAQVDEVRPAVPGPVTVIGQITGGAPGVTLVGPDGQLLPGKQRGWEHFVSR